MTYFLTNGSLCCSDHASFSATARTLSFNGSGLQGAVICNSAAWTVQLLDITEGLQTLTSSYNQLIMMNSSTMFLTTNINSSIVNLVNFSNISDWQQGFPGGPSTNFGYEIFCKLSVSKEGYYNFCALSNEGSLTNLQAQSQLPPPRPIEAAVTWVRNWQQLSLQHTDPCWANQLKHEIALCDACLYRW